jgi:hypothetical protein
LKVGCPECGCVFHKWQHVRSWNKGSIVKFFENASFKTLNADVRTLTAAFPARMKLALQQIASIFGYQVPKHPNLLYLGSLQEK